MNWISVNDQLPTPIYQGGEDVLAYYQILGSKCSKGATVGRHAGHGAWELQALRVRSGDVTHWMPLPEPPEEDSK